MKTIKTAWKATIVDGTPTPNQLKLVLIMIVIPACIIAGLFVNNFRWL